MAVERHVLADGDAVAAAAAGLVLAALASAPGPRSAVCLAGGSTPQRLYRGLATSGDPALTQPGLHWFPGDERLVPPDHPDNNLSAIRRHLLDPLGSPSANIHPVPSVGLSAEEAASAYEADLRAFYGGDRLDPNRPLFDVVLLGLGEDGHTASLFPGSPALAERQRWAAGVAMSGLAPFVPRVTLTFPALASSRLTLVLVSGAGKRAALQALAAGEDLPAAGIGGGRVVWLLDAAASPD
jgi:6-phosphogluconolactonase